MTYKNRPAWDLEFWNTQGYLCQAYENLNSQIFSQEEQIHYQAHPVFLVEVSRKPWKERLWFCIR